MIIILILLLLQILLWISERKYTKYLISISFLVFLTSITWLLIFQAELWSNNIWNNDYGSDARYYWNAMVSVYLQEQKYTDFLAPLYVGWGSLILKTSVFPSILWVKLSNILLYSLSANMLYIIISNRLDRLHVSLRSMLLIMFLLLTNGIIVWTVIRNLKETFFTFVCIFYLFTLDKVVNKNMKNRTSSRVLIFSIIISVYLILNAIRPLGGVYAIILGGTYFMSNIFINQTKVKWKNLQKYLFFVIILLIFLIVNKLDLISAFRELYIKDLVESSGESYLEDFSHNMVALLPLSALRFILGPGPIRSLRQLIYQDIFLVSMRSGDVLIFIGSSLWWFMLIILFFNIFHHFKSFLNISKYFLDFYSFCFAFLMAYSYLGGTGDTRLRSVLYFFSTPIFIMSFFREKDGR